MLLLATEAEVWSIVAAVAGAVSAIAAMIACILTYRTTRPKIKVKINKIMLVEWFSIRFAVADIVVTNKSSVAGTVSELSLYKGRRKNKVECESEYESQIYDTGAVEITATTNGIPSNAKQFKLPFAVEPFQGISGYIRFPELPISFKVGDTVRISYRNANDIFCFRWLRSIRRTYKLEKSTYTFEYKRADGTPYKPASGNDIDNCAN